MKTMTCIVLAGMITIFMGGVTVFGENAQPGLINAQGRLVEPDGTLVHGTRDMAFCIYTDPTDGELLWGDTLSVLVWGGVYDVMLGPIPQVVFYDSLNFNPIVRRGGDRWLGTTIIGDSELQPRERIATVGYAIHTDMVDGRDASEFVSSVHPDTAQGLDTAGKADRCKNTVPMLTVINDCDGGGIEGKCLTGTGVTGNGKIGVYGLASLAEDTAIFAQAFHPDSIAGRFDGNVTLSGDGQLGLDGSDYHHLKVPGSQAWGWLYPPKPLDGMDAMDIGYNYHVDPAGNEFFDNNGSGRATSRIRLGHGWLLFTAGSAMQRPDTVMSIDPSGKVKIEGGVCGPRLDCDTLQVTGPGSSEWAWIGGSSPAAADTACPACVAAPGGNCQVDGSVYIGTTAPQAVKLHVSGSGTYGTDSHMVLFENTGGANGDGIAIKLNATTPDKLNRFMSFLDGSGNPRGRIEGLTAGNLADDPKHFAYDNWYWYQYAVTQITAVAAMTAFTGCICYIPPFLFYGAFCYPPLGGLVGAIAQEAAIIAQGLLYLDYLNGEDYKGVSYQSGSGDYAEWLKRSDPGEQMQPGDIVGVVGGRICKSTIGAHQLLVVSEAPAVVGNAPPQEEEYLYEKVAFLGQVPVRVNGPVREGDYIIPSGFEDGTGIAVSPELMTAAEFSKVVGRAWSGSQSPSLNMITAIVGINSGDMASLVRKNEMETRAIEDEVAAVKMQLSDFRGLDQKVEQLKTAFRSTAEKKKEFNPAPDLEVVEKNAGPDVEK